MAEKPRLSSLLIKPVSADCNLECSYCFYRPKQALYPDSARHRMSDDILRAMTEQYLDAAGAHASFCWQGGEPTLAGLAFFERAVQWQRDLGQPGQQVENAFQTNGILVDRAWAEFFRRNSILVGLSLDGPEALHDRQRRFASGRGSYSGVLRTLRLFQQCGVEFNTMVLLTRTTGSDGGALFSFLFNQGAGHLQFIPCLERNGRGEPTDFSVAPEQYGKLLCGVFDKWLIGGRAACYIRDFEAWAITLATGQHPLCIYAPRCGDYLVVEHNGDVYPCDFFVEPEWKLGNLMERPLLELFRSPLMDKFRARKPQLAPECRECEWLRFCNGGCPRHRVRSGADSSPSYFCEGYKLFFEQKLGALREAVETLQKTYGR